MARNQQPFTTAGCFYNHRNLSTCSCYSVDISFDLHNFAIYPYDCIVTFHTDYLYADISYAAYGYPISDAAYPFYLFDPNVDATCFCSHHLLHYYFLGDIYLFSNNSCYGGGAINH